MRDTEKMKRSIDRNSMMSFVYIAISIIVIDLITTVIGLRMGFHETNNVALKFMSIFGDMYGLIVSMLGKILLLISPMLVYKFFEKHLGQIQLKDTFWILYSLVVIVSIISTLDVVIDNIIIIS